MKRGLANTPFSARAQRFTAAAAEIRREGAKRGEKYVCMWQRRSLGSGERALKLPAGVAV